MSPERHSRAGRLRLTTSPPRALVVLLLALAPAHAAAASALDAVPCPDGGGACVLLPLFLRDNEGSAATLRPDPPTNPDWHPATVAYTYNGSLFLLKLTPAAPLDLPDGGSLRFLLHRAAPTDATYVTEVALYEHTGSGHDLLASGMVSSARRGPAPPVPYEKPHDWGTPESAAGDGWSDFEIPLPPGGLVLLPGRLYEAWVVTRWDGALSDVPYKSAVFACETGVFATREYQKVGKPWYHAAADVVESLLPTENLRRGWRDWLVPALEIELFDHNERHFHDPVCPGIDHGAGGVGGIENRFDAVGYPARVELTVRS